MIAMTHCLQLGIPNTLPSNLTECAHMHRYAAGNTCADEVGLIFLECRLNECSPGIYIYLTSKITSRAPIQTRQRLPGHCMCNNIAWREELFSAHRLGSLVYLQESCSTSAKHSSQHPLMDHFGVHARTVVSNLATLHGCRNWSDSWQLCLRWCRNKRNGHLLCWA